jgi:hypothetical protein
VRGAEVVLEQLARRRELARQVWGFAVRPEGVLEVLVLEDDDPHVLDRRRVGARRRREGEQEQGGDKHGAHRAGR